MPGAEIRDLIHNIVLLSSNSGWVDETRAQARALGLVRVHTTGCVQEVLALLAGGFPPVSHLLLEPDAAGSLLSELVDLTAGQRDGVELVVIGEPEGLPRHPSAAAMSFVPTPTKDWLRRALDLKHPYQRSTPPLTVPDLLAAVTNGGIRTRYQPIVRLDNGRPVGLEVLARLEHEVRGVLQPDMFVPQLEEAGLAWPLTLEVIKSAFADWGDGKLGSFGLTMALNFPLDVLLVPEALTWLETHRRKAGLPAEQIVIELTESRPVREIMRLRHVISTLRGIGYGIAIDDVGPELRDHEALLDLQFTELKLDKELVRESPDSPAATAFLRRAIDAARAAQLTIVAEGVEDEDIWRRMQQLGVDQAQGFLIARPLPAAAVPLWYRNWTQRLDR